MLTPAVPFVYPGVCSVGVANSSTGLERPVLLGRATEQTSENVGVVLAESVGAGPDRPIQAGLPPEGARVDLGADDLVVNLLEEASRREVRVVQDLHLFEDRSRGDAGGLEALGERELILRSGPIANIPIQYVLVGPWAPPRLR